MAISVVDLGTNSNTSGSTLALTCAAAAAAASVVFVAVHSGGNTTYSTGASVADSKSNTYTAIGTAYKYAGIDGVGYTQLFYAKNITALTTSDTITVTKQGTGQYGMQAIVLAGADTTAPLDTSVTANANTSSLQTSVSITSGSPAVANEMFIGILGMQLQGATAYTQASGFSTPPASVNLSGSNPQAAGAGGTQLNTGTGTKTFAPSWDVSSRASAIIVGFKPATFNYTSSITESVTAATSAAVVAAFVSAISESATATADQNAGSLIVDGITEAAAATEVSDRAFTTQASITEAGTASEAQTVIAAFASAIAEAGTSTSTQAALAAFVSAITEAATATAAQTVTGIFFRSVSEAATASHTNAATVAFIAAITNAASATSTQSVLARFLATVTEAGIASDRAFAVLKSVVQHIRATPASLHKIHVTEPTLDKRRVTGPTLQD